MGGWASVSFFCSGRAGGRRDFVVENRVGVGGRPGTPGPVGGPAVPFLLFILFGAKLKQILTESALKAQADQSMHNKLIFRFLAHTLVLSGPANPNPNPNPSLS